MKLYSQSTLLLLILLILSGCMSLTQTQKDPSVLVEQRINGLMTAKVNGDWSKVYYYFDSNFRNKISEKSFLMPNKAKFKTYRIEYIKVDSSGEWADALVKSEIKAMGYDLKNLPEKQHWILEKGKWVVVVNPSRNFID